MRARDAFRRRSALQLRYSREMRPRVVRRARSVESVTLFVAALLSLGCSADMHPFHDCDPTIDVGCAAEDEAALNCRVESGNPFLERYVPVRTPCARSERCRVAGGAAHCVVSEASCSPGAPRRCEGNDVVACAPLDPTDPSLGLELVVSRCQFGNVCVDGDCVAMGNEVCDPATFALACRGGRPVLCTELEGVHAGQHRVVYAEDVCGDGNRCIEAEGFVACGVSESPCDNTFRNRCEGGGVIRCTASYPRAGRGWTGVERRFPCAAGCGETPAGGDCVATAH